MRLQCVTIKALSVVALLLLTHPALSEEEENASAPTTQFDPMQKASGGQEKTLSDDNLGNGEDTDNKEEIEAYEEESEESKLRITLDMGTLLGVKDISTEGREFYSFMSIPYAKPPLGDLRFHRPLPVSGWEGERDATRMPEACPQFSMISLIQGKDDPSLIGSEDCLYLNVFTHAPNKDGANLPVMVFIHGGGFLAGSTADYPPHVLMNEDIVLVSLNYRLGTLGFLSTEDDVIPGNFGLMDQTLALKWVQKYIPNFGGNPVNVTIFGESAGGASVHFQIMTPRSIGLFGRAVMQSGTGFLPGIVRKDHRKNAFIIGEHLGCEEEKEEEEGGESEKLLRCLRKAPMEKLVPTPALFQKFLFWPSVMMPRIDGNFLPLSAEGTLVQKRHKNVDLMSGFTRDDGSLFSAMLVKDPAAQRTLIEKLDEVGPLLLALEEEGSNAVNLTAVIFSRYLDELGDDVPTAIGLTKLFTDRFFSIPHEILCRFHLRNSGPKYKKTYMYEFNYRGNYSLLDITGAAIPREWVSHHDDMQYLFTGTPIMPRLTSEEDIKMQKLMTKLWTNFAKTGNPTPDDSLGFRWEPAAKDSFRHLRIDKMSHMEDDNKAKERSFWLSLPLGQNKVLRSAKQKETPKEGETSRETLKEGEETSKEGEETSKEGEETSKEGEETSKEGEETSKEMSKEKEETSKEEEETPKEGEETPKEEEEKDSKRRDEL